jgi:hypothetical protein
MNQRIYSEEEIHLRKLVLRKKSLFEKLKNKKQNVDYSIIEEAVIEIDKQIKQYKELINEKHNTI